MTDSPRDPEPPRLQDTGERAALPLPLPGSQPADAPGDAPLEQWAPPEAQAQEQPGDEPAPVEGGDEPAPVEGAAEPEPPPPEPTAPTAPELPPYEPAPAVSELRGDGGGAPSEHPELLVGAAFVGGFALALLIKRLAS